MNYNLNIAADYGLTDLNISDIPEWLFVSPNPDAPQYLTFDFQIGEKLASLLISQRAEYLLLNGAEVGRIRLSPNDMWPGYSSNGTNITIPLSALTGLSAEEADATIGNWLDILQAILRREEIYISEITLLKRPKAVGIFRLSDYNYTHITLGRCLKRTFLQHFNILFSSATIRDEP